MASRKYSNIAVETTLVSGIDASVVSLQVADATGWPAAPFAILIDEGEVTEELILVGAKSGTTFSSLTRGYGGTSGAAHSGSAAVKLVITAEDFALIWAHVHTGAGGDDTAVVSHDSLSDVSANDHHNQVHAIGGADHSGTLDHGALSGLTDDDHTLYLKEKASGGLAAEVPEHTHVSAAEGGTISYATDAELSAHDADADAHHAQDHAASHAPGGADALDITDFEVDGSVEVGGPIALTTTLAAVATVNLTIPASWGSWKCFVTASYTLNWGAADTADVEIRIDGTSQQTKQVITAASNAATGDAISARRTGMVTTGSRAIELRMKEGGTVSVSDIFLYARAVRIS